MKETCALLGLPMRCYSPVLAMLLGEGPATVLQTLHWRLLQSPHTYGGVPWVYDTYEAWQRDWFPHWTTRTVKRHVESLRTRGLVRTRKDLNAHGYDTTLWYTIDEDALRRLDGLQDVVPQRSDNLSPPAPPGPRPKGQSGTSSIWPKGQNVTDETLRLSNQEQDTLPEQDDVPDGEGESSVGCPPAPPPLAGGAAEGQAPVSVEEPVALCGCGWPFTALVVQEREPPAPAHPVVSVSPCPETAGCPGVPAKPLAAPHGEAAVPVPATRFAAAPQSGGAGKERSRATSACVPVPPPECGPSYVPCRWPTPQEVGHTLDERGCRFLSPGFVATLTTRYGKEYAHA